MSELGLGEVLLYMCIEELDDMCVGMGLEGDFGVLGFSEVSNGVGS